MNKTIRIVLLSVAFAMPAMSMAGPISFELGHTVQNCKHAGHQPTWCDGAPPSPDIAESAKASGLDAKITALLDRAIANPAKARVLAAQFSFSNKVIQKKFCELGKAGVKVQIVLDYGSQGNLEFIRNDSQRCQKDQSKPNLTASLLGGFTDFPDWRLHHNKTLVIDLGDGSPVDVAFSSGNLSVFGTSLHMDHWVFAKAPANSNLVRAQSCLFEGLTAAVAKAKETGMYAGAPEFDHDPAVLEAYKGTRETCYKKNGVIAMSDWETALDREGIAPFYTPNYGHEALNALKAQIRFVTAQAKAGKPGQYIYVAIEHFLNGALGRLFNEAANAGVDVAIVFNSSTVTGASEVAGDKDFMEQNLKPNKRIKLRFIETNPNAGGNGQQMHNKFAILSGVRVFSGAGHYTTSGLDTNWETLYLTRDQNLTKQYAKYFKKLWDQSVDEAYLDEGTGTIKPAPALLKSFTWLATQP